jgi:hypothetical protein
LEESLEKDREREILARGEKEKAQARILSPSARPSVTTAQVLQTFKDKRKNKNIMVFKHNAVFFFFIFALFFVPCLPFVPFCYNKSQNFARLRDKLSG